MEIIMSPPSVWRPMGARNVWTSLVDDLGGRGGEGGEGGLGDRALQNCDENKMPAQL